MTATNHFNKTKLIAVINLLQHSFPLNYKKQKNLYFHRSMYFQIQIAIFKYYRCRFKQLIEKSYSIYVVSLDRSLVDDPIQFWIFVNA